MGEENKLNKFEQFLSIEYEHIANAHLKTLETISTFFKHYLVIMGIPIVVVAYLFRKGENESFADLLLPGGILLILLSIIGFLVMCYVMNLRMDALLYARTVNGIRKYFYNESAIDEKYKLRIRTLPQTITVPLYFEPYFFLPVISAFALFNAIYLFFGIILIGFNNVVLNAYSTIPPIIYFVFHIYSYQRLAKTRESSYLKSSCIGVDIDGVLNNHRQQFCKFINENTDKNINPDKITHIPVHESELNIERKEELDVFNNPQYWSTMPIAEGSVEALRKLKNEFNYKVLLFTERPWPLVSEDSNYSSEDLNKNWKSEFISLHKEVKHHSPLYTYRLSKRLYHITSLWLEKHKYEYDDLIMEGGLSSHMNQSILFRSTQNRFAKSAIDNIKIFVEDDKEKADKLSYICDIVFLIDHPYNQAKNKELPINVIRVNNWKDIYKYIRAIS